jgi:hypothetical protein
MADFLGLGQLGIGGSIDKTNGGSSSITESSKVFTDYKGEKTMGRAHCDTHRKAKFEH